MTRNRLAAALIVVALAVAACGGGSKSSSGADGSSGNGGNGATHTFVMPAGGSGSCHVEIKGDGVDINFTQKQDMGSLLVSQWMSKSSRATLDLKDGEESLLMNCRGTGGSVSFMSAADTTSAQFPKSAKTYVISSGGLLGSDTPGEIGAIINIESDKLIWGLSEPGTFDVKTFGGNHFAGTFSAKLEGTDLQDAHKTATLTGTFDFTCTGDACS